MEISELKNFKTNQVNKIQSAKRKQANIKKNNTILLQEGSTI